MEPLEEDYDAVRDYVGRELGMAHLAPLADAHHQGTIKGLVVQPGGQVFVPLHVSPNNTDCRPAVNVLWARAPPCGLQLGQPLGLLPRPLAEGVG